MAIYLQNCTNTMIFKELETKQLFDNSYGNSVWIDRYVYYNGTEQISIYVKNGYGADEKVVNVVISEHELEEWIANFKSSVTLLKTNINMDSENKVNNFDSMREIIFDSMKMVKERKLTPDEAKSISILGQTIINSVKVEVDFIKASGSNIKLKMII